MLVSSRPWKRKKKTFSNCFQIGSLNKNGLLVLKTSIMKKIPFLDIFKKSLKITWKNKFLWICGFLILLDSLFSVFANRFENSSMNFYPTITLLLFIALSFLLLKLLSIASIIKVANNDVVYGQSSLLAIISETKKYVVRLLAQQIIIFLMLIFFVGMLFSPVSYSLVLKNYILVAIFLFIASIISIYLLVVAYLIIKYARMFVVLADVSVRNSLEMAYSLFEKNVKESLLMILAAIGVYIFAIIASFVSALATLIILAPFFLLENFFSAKYLLLPTALVAIIAVCLQIIWLLSLMHAYVQTVWVLFFQKITLESKKEEEKLVEANLAEEMPTPEPV